MPDDDGVRRVLVAGIGNVFLGDDGFGPEVVRRLDVRTLAGPRRDVRVVDYGIRGLHLAYDLLEGWDAVVLVDAVPGRGSPGRVGVLEVGAGRAQPARLDAHAMDPAAVLASLEALGGTRPRTLVVGCEVTCVDEGMGLSAPVDAAVDETARLLAGLVGQLVGDRAAAGVG